MCTLFLSRDRLSVYAVKAFAADGWRDSTRNVRPCLLQAVFSCGVHLGHASSFAHRKWSRQTSTDVALSPSMKTPGYPACPWWTRQFPTFPSPRSYSRRPSSRHRWDISVSAGKRAVRFSLFSRRGYCASCCAEGHGRAEFARAANGFGKRVLRLFGAVVILGPKSPSSVVGHSKVRRSYVQLVTAAVVFRHVVRGIRAVFDEAKEPWQFRPGDYDARREERSQGIKS